MPRTRHNSLDELLLHGSSTCLNTGPRSAMEPITTFDTGAAAAKHELDDQDQADPQASPPQKAKSRKGKKGDDTKKRRCISSARKPEPTS